MHEPGKNWLPLALLGAAFATLGVPAWFGGDPPPVPPARSSDVVRRGLEPIVPVPAPAPADPDRVELGRRLFHDARLSSDGTISCASCHSLATGGTDRRPRSIGVGGVEGRRNAPTVFNSALNFRQFWDGRADDLHEQVAAPLLAADEMASSWEHVLAVLDEDPRYREDFQDVYGELTAEAVTDAIATFEASLLTPGAPFDRWLLGEEEALTADALAGYHLFQELGCIACHQGAGVGGNMFQRFGLLRDADRSTDLGRYEVTGEERDRHVFKVPGLRNVAQTAPYFHDGSVPTLEEAVRVMALVQLDVELDAEEVRLLVCFLESLSGDVPR